MQEVLPGVFHWDTLHPRINFQVASYWLDGEGVLIDPLVPSDVGMEWFADRAVTPRAILLSNRHHYRDSSLFAERFRCPVYCNSAGLHEFTHGESVQGFEPGDSLAGGVLACRVDAICPDDSALYMPEQRGIVFADGVVLGPAPEQVPALGFVPDSLMDDPPLTKRGLLDSCATLLGELEFEHLLLAHGGPVIGDGRAQLEQLVDCGGRTAFEF